ncbi:type VI secretion system-associated protein TagF [Sphingomonas sp. HF-S3]|uniref:Type VI secretion system-associated protein TagF n=1 Tax=Sphingomonas rustica TaxID=3103142 RepID=A0ABV0BD44_9SPHN
MSVGAVSAVRLFGKLPSHGDFVVRGMAMQDRDALDAWLSDSIADARETLGDRFEPLYDSAPPWRFAVAGEVGWLAGALVPSMDRPGRRFPVWLALDGVELEAAGAAAVACEELLYRAFAEAWDADRVVAEAAALTPTEGEPAPERASWWTGGGIDFPPSTILGERPRHLFRAMLASEEQA